MTQVFNTTEDASASYGADIVDENDSPITLASLLTLTLTLTNEEDGSIINGRSSQNVLNQNNVVITSGGALTWSLQAADNVIVNERIQPTLRERHIATFNWTYGSGKAGSHTFYIDVLQSVAETPEHYGSVAGGDFYFSVRLNNDPWIDATETNKLAALVEATRLIDRLNFKGSKTVSTQYLQFPRSTDTSVPDSITHATYELALKLLDDYDPDLEVENLSRSLRQYDKIREEYDRSFVPEHILAGIPSIRAWSYLKPYLRDPFEVKVSRVS